MSDRYGYTMLHTQIVEPVHALPHYLVVSFHRECLGIHRLEFHSDAVLGKERCELVAHERSFLIRNDGLHWTECSYPTEEEALHEVDGVLLSVDVTCAKPRGLVQ